MDRKNFIRSGLLAIPFTARIPFQEQVEEFVRAGHNDLEKVKQMLIKDPSLVHAAYNWGNNDFETALEGASHVGDKSIATYLIEQGARPSLFTMAMLGETDSVKSWIKKFPEALRSRGPHGFTLLHHAIAGENKELEQWLLDSGLKDRKY